MYDQSKRKVEVKLEFWRKMLIEFGSYIEDFNQRNMQ